MDRKTTALIISLIAIAAIITLGTRYAHQDMTLQDKEQKDAAYEHLMNSRTYKDMLDDAKKYEMDRYSIILRLHPENSIPDEDKHDVLAILAVTAKEYRHALDIRDRMNRDCLDLKDIDITKIGEGWQAIFQKIHKMHATALQALGEPEEPTDSPQMTEDVLLQKRYWALKESIEAQSGQAQALAEAELPNAWDFLCTASMAYDEIELASESQANAEVFERHIMVIQSAHHYADSILAMLEKRWVFPDGQVTEYYEPEHIPIS